MAVETLAQPYVFDEFGTNDWEIGDGTSAGMWVFKFVTGWVPVLELYVYGSGQWNYVIPIRGVSCQIQSVSNGTCGAVDASFKIKSTWLGPQPQKTSGTGDFYQIKSYDRFSNVSAADLLTQPWNLRSTISLTQSVMLPAAAHTYGFVITTGVTQKWHQAQARLVHTVTGEVPEASGGIVTSLFRKIVVDDCGG